MSSSKYRLLCMLCIFHTSKALYALIRCVGENNVKRLYVAGSTGSVVSRVGLGLQTWTEEGHRQGRFLIPKACVPLI